MSYLLLALLISAPLTTAAVEVPMEAGITAMTFNLRYGTAKDEGHRWEDRKAAALMAITESHPDVLGLQESLDFQNEFLIESLGAEYEFIGEGRNGGTKGEYASLFFRKDRFYLAQAGRFWLSDTPEVAGSMTWADLPRIVTWADLVEKENATRLFVLNTHFAHNSDEARKKSTELIRKRLFELVPNGARVLMMGDFNCVPGSEPYQILLGEGEMAFQDAMTATGTAPRGTFHGFKGPVEGGQPIDWILFRGGLRAIEYKVLTDLYANQYPSDHFPVTARFKME
jgi:endonuclease/exonuclease/phosphatase family metal-dependent hydrolase